MARFDDPVTAIKYLAEPIPADQRRWDRANWEKMSYVDLAEKIGVDQSTLWRIVKGKTQASRIVRKNLTELATHTYVARQRVRARAKKKGAAHV